MVEVPDIATRNRLKAVAAARGVTPGDLISDHAKALEIATFGKPVVIDTSTDPNRAGNGGQGAGQQEGGQSEG
jgi:hypothetical protein